MTNIIVFVSIALYKRAMTHKSQETNEKNDALSGVNNNVSQLTTCDWITQGG